MCALCYAGILFFFLGNCLNFISFGYAAQVSYRSCIPTVLLICNDGVSFSRTLWKSFFPLLSISCSFHFSLPSLLSVQSLLAALGSIQFVSNIAFAYFVLNKMVTVKYVKWEVTQILKIIAQFNISLTTLLLLSWFQLIDILFLFSESW
jgi:hypothetical protein